MTTTRLRQLPAIAALGLSLAIAGCGFQLRGTAVNEINLRQLHVVSQDSHSELAEQLRERLRNDGVQLGSAAPWHLQLIEERWNSRTLARANRNSTTERELELVVRYALSNTQGDVLLGPDQLSVQRILLVDGNNFTAVDEEEQMLRREMRNDLLQQLNLRLSRLDEQELQRRQRDAEASR